MRRVNPYASVAFAMWTGLAFAQTPVYDGITLRAGGHLLGVPAGDVTTWLGYTPVNPSALGAAAYLGVGTNLSTSAGNIVLTSAGVVGALGFTPVNPSMLGGAASLSVGTGSGTVAAGNDSRIVGAAQSSALGAAAALNVGTAAGTVAAGNDSRIIGAVQAAALGSATITATGQTTSRTLSAWAAEHNNLKFMGGVGDGVTDDTAAVAACATAGSCYVPLGLFKTSLNSSALSVKFAGPGQIGTTNGAGAGRAPFFQGLTSAPAASIGSGSGPFAWGTAYGSDISRTLFPIEAHVTGAATLGQPASGYLNTPEASPILLWMNNQSGWNQDTGDNGGRTGVAAIDTLLTQAGQGDMVAYTGNIQIQSTKAGATHFLASPAGVLFNGQVSATVNGAYMQGIEINLDGGTNDVAAIGQVLNMARRNATGALSATWVGNRMQSIGTVAVDAFYSAVGPSKTGLDFTGANFGTNQAAVALAANQRVYLNATNTDPNNLPNGISPGNIWVAYDSGTAKIVIGNGTTRLFSIDPATGNVVAKGTITPNGSP